MVIVKFCDLMTPVTAAIYGCIDVAYGPPRVWDVPYRGERNCCLRMPVVSGLHQPGGLASPALTITPGQQSMSPTMGHQPSGLGVNLFLPSGPLRVFMIFSHGWCCQGAAGHWMHSGLPTKIRLKPPRRSFGRQCLQAQHSGVAGAGGTQLRTPLT